MALLVTDPHLEERLKAEREASGADRFDEVWEGVYMMAPLADNEHQWIQSRLVVVFSMAMMDRPEIRVLGNVNVSDRRKNWVQNYRIPDLAVFMPDTLAQDHGTHWAGGPDFVIEITSPNENTRHKLDFYSQVKTRELLILDRENWSLELYQLRRGKLTKAGTSSAKNSKVLQSGLLPLSLAMQKGKPRPQVEVRRTAQGQKWVI